MRVVKTKEVGESILFESDSTKSEIIGHFEQRIANYKGASLNPARIHYSGFQISRESIYVQFGIPYSLHIYVEDAASGRATIKFEPVTGRIAIRSVVAIGWVIVGISLFGGDIIEGKFGIVTRLGLAIWGGAGLLIALYVFFREVFNRSLFRKYVDQIVRDLNA